MWLLVGIAVLAFFHVYGRWVQKLEDSLRLHQYPRQKPSDDPRWIPGHIAF